MNSQHANGTLYSITYIREDIMVTMVTETHIQKQSSWLRMLEEKKSWPGKHYTKEVSWSGLPNAAKHLFIADSCNNTREVGITNICLIVGRAAPCNREKQMRRRSVLSCLPHVPQILVLVKRTVTYSPPCGWFCCVSFITWRQFQSVHELRATAEEHVCPLF
jgi:hypothetical protein